MPMSRYMHEIRRLVGKRLLEVPAVSVVVRDRHDRVLPVKHSEFGSWMTPGGAIEPAETPADAAVREVWEETGLEVRPTRLAGVFGGPECVVRYRNGDETSYAIILFEAEILGGETGTNSREILEVRFFAKSELAELTMPPWMPEAMRAAIGGDGGAAFRPPIWRPAAAD